MSTQTETTTTVPSSETRFTFRHIPELDGFRGLALVVVIGHYLEFRGSGVGSGCIVQQRIPWANLRVSRASLLRGDLYLWQQMFLVTSQPSWGLSRRLPFSVVIPLVVAAAWLHFFERPILRLKERYAPQAAG